MLHKGFPGGLNGKETPAMKRHGFNPWVGKIPWEREWQPTPVSGLENSINIGAWSREGNHTPTPVFLPGKSHGRRSLVGCSPWGH